MLSHRNARSTWAVVALALAFAAQATTTQAQTLLYQNYTQPMTITGDDYLRGPGTVGGLMGWGFQFVPTASGVVSSIDVALSNSSGNGTVTFDLYADNGSNRLGALLDSMPLTASIPSASSDPPVTNIPSVNEPYLTAGDTYWLVGMASGSVCDYWTAPQTGVAGNDVIVRATGDSYSTTDVGNKDAAFDIQSTPEPGALALLLSGGLTGAGTMSRRLRRARPSFRR
jgi:hypothetical protein